MGKYVLHIPADDGCVYIYDIETRTLSKHCSVTSIFNVPDVVKATLAMAGLPLAGQNNGL
jgi:hypothetical protein